MRKASPPEETEDLGPVKKRRSRRQSQPGATVVTDETCQELEQLKQLEKKAGAAQDQDQKFLQDDVCSAEAQGKEAVQPLKSRGDESPEDVAARKQVETQRQRLEEALLLAKERRRAEELAVQGAPANRHPEVRNTTTHLVGYLGPKSDSAKNWKPSVSDSEVNLKAIDPVSSEKGIVALSENGDLFGQVLERLKSKNSQDRASALNDLSRIARDQAFPIISKAFDDPSVEVRNAAAKALYNLDPDAASTFTQALRDASPERRRQIGSSLAASGLASDALGNLAGASRERTHEALTLLFLMAKAGEIRPLMRTIEEGQNLEVRLAVVNLLALSGRAEIIPPFRRLAVRGSLPAEVRSAVMEAIYQISAQQREMAKSR